MNILNFPQVDSNVTCSFVLDGQEYEVEEFRISFHQGVDPIKNQPESEVRGGKIIVTLNQAVKSNIYGWAMKPWMKKDGSILFKTGTSGVIFNVDFKNGYCISLKRSVNTTKGLNTSLTISSECVIMNGIELDNNWVK